ncbi:MAG: FAD-dependent oxidoreductase [Leptospirales bacterium]|nr:FAD-dependent oxidoreductase [Leptospirales bacterium]
MSRSTEQESRAEVCIVGGGIGGLAAALLSARSGRKTILLEKSSRAGGLARSRVLDGFVFNAGPRALYTRGFSLQFFRRLGVSVAGHPVGSDGAWWRFEGRIRRLPAGFRATLQSGLLPGELWELARAYGKLEAVSVAKENRSAAEWIVGHSRRSKVRALLAGLARLSTYGDEGSLEMSAVARQLLLARGGVQYIDGGWQSIVEQLQRLAAAAGVQFRSSAAVQSLEAQGKTWRLALADGNKVSTNQIILAVPPTAAAAITQSRQLGDFAAAASPIRAACLDIALRRLPVASRTFLMDCDRRSYLSVHSSFARLAPEGGALIHCLRYAPDTDADQATLRPELEEMLDEFQPGWRRELARARFLPDMSVSAAAPGPSRPRFPGCALAELPGVFVCGDWVDSDHLLLDGVLSSVEQCVGALGVARQAA